MAVQTAEEARREYVKRCVDEAPPLTAEQFAALRELFRPVRPSRRAR